MPVRVRVFLVLLALLGAAAPARAQSCWPVGVFVLLRDEQGNVIDPRALDAPRLESKPVRQVPYIGHAAYLDTTGPEGIRWGVITPCRLHLDELTLTYRGKTMRLRFRIHLDSDVRRGPSAFAIEAPPFREGTFVLDWNDGEEGGRSEDPKWIRADRWRPVPAAGAAAGG